MQFNEKLKKLRAERGISQSELAEKIFVSRSAVAKWENGLGLPNEQSLNMLADYFGVAPSHLMSDPLTENVIVTKNHSLSRQKIWIGALISLLLCVCAAAIALTVLYCNAHDNTQPPMTYEPPEPIVTRELIFETEEYLYTDNIPSYGYDELDAECEFAPSRSFAMEWESTITYLPALLVRTTTDGVVSYENVDYNAVNVKVKGDEIYLQKVQQGLCAGPTSNYLRFFEGYANLEYDGMTISIKVYNVPLRVQQVETFLADLSTEIQLTGSKCILTSITPYNASFQDVTYNVEKIQFPDGTICEEGIEEYAAVVNTSGETSYTRDERLITTEKAPIGAKIYITATADGVTSKPLVVEVVRIPVDRIYLYLNGSNSQVINQVMLGSENSFSLRLYPENATANILQERSTVTLLTPELATLEETESGWTVRVTDDVSKWREEIAIQVESSDGVSKIGYWYINGIEVESVTLLNAETNEELDDVTYLTHGSTLRLKAVVLPENADYDHVSYAYISDTTNYGAYVKLSDDGVITVEKNAPIGMEISIRAVAGRGNMSKSYRIIIEKIPLERVTLSLETSEVLKGTIYSINTELFPANADCPIIWNYYLLEDLEGISLSGNMFFVTTAPGGTVFHVQVEIDDVKSNILELTVVENPLEQLKISLATDKVSSWQIYEIKVNTEPKYADYEQLTFMLLDEIDGIYLSGNKLMIAPEVKSGTVFNIQAVADGIESNILTLTVVDDEEPTR